MKVIYSSIGFKQSHYDYFPSDMLSGMVKFHEKLECFAYHGCLDKIKEIEQREHELTKINIIGIITASIYGQHLDLIEYLINRYSICIRPIHGELAASLGNTGILDLLQKPFMNNVVKNSEFPEEFLYLPLIKQAIQNEKYNVLLYLDTKFNIDLSNEKYYDEYNSIGIWVFDGDKCPNDDIISWVLEKKANLINNNSNPTVKDIKTLWNEKVLETYKNTLSEYYITVNITEHTGQRGTDILNEVYKRLVVTHKRLENDKIENNLPKNIQCTDDGHYGRSGVGFAFYK